MFSCCYPNSPSSLDYGDYVRFDPNTVAQKRRRSSVRQAQIDSSSLAQSVSLMDQAAHPTYKETQVFNWDAYIDLMRPNLTAQNQELSAASFCPASPANDVSRFANQSSIEFNVKSNESPPSFPPFPAATPPQTPVYSHSPAADESPSSYSMSASNPQIPLPRPQSSLTLSQQMSSKQHSLEQGTTLTPVIFSPHESEEEEEEEEEEEDGDQQNQQPDSNKISASISPPTIPSAGVETKSTTSPLTAGAATTPTASSSSVHVKSRNRGASIISIGASTIGSERTASRGDFSLDLAQRDFEALKNTNISDTPKTSRSSNKEAEQTPHSVGDAKNRIALLETPKKTSSKALTARPGWKPKSFVGDDSGLRTKDRSKMVDFVDDNFLKELTIALNFTREISQVDARGNADVALREKATLLYMFLCAVEMETAGKQNAVATVCSNVSNHAVGPKALATAKVQQAAKRLQFMVKAYYRPLLDQLRQPSLKHTVEGFIEDCHSTASVLMGDRAPSLRERTDPFLKDILTRWSWEQCGMWQRNDAENYYKSKVKLVDQFDACRKGGDGYLGVVAEIEQRISREE